MTRFLGLIAILIAFAGNVSATDSSGVSHSFFADMVVLRDSTSARVSSYDRSGRNADSYAVLPGQTLELAAITGAGCIRHIYFTVLGQEHYLSDLVIRMYWDGEDHPSVEAPFGGFFGLGHGQPRFFSSLLVSVNPGTGTVGTFGFNCYFPMPFARGARLTLSNEGSDPAGVWYHIDYEKLEKIDDHVARFHAQWRQETPTTAVGDNINVTSHDAVNLDAKENYVILDAKGHGNVVGYFLNVDNVAAELYGEDDDTWYGEGDDMIFIDGEEWPPSLHGTGTEEIFGAGACPNVEYAGPYTGYHLVANRDYHGKVSMYRFFVTDPIRFQKSIRVTLEHGHANNMANNYSSCVFWYQAEPHEPFPELTPALERRPRAGTDPHDTAYQEVQRLQEKAFEALATLNVNQIQKAVTIKLMRALEDQDYDTASEECRAGVLLLDELIEQCAARTGK